MTRRVLLLETDERAGLVAALTAVCAEREISLEISTGPGHVLITFQADDAVTTQASTALERVPGVASVRAYAVATA